MKVLTHKQKQQQKKKFDQGRWARLGLVFLVVLLCGGSIWSSQKDTRRMASSAVTSNQPPAVGAAVIPGSANANTQTSTNIHETNTNTFIKKTSGNNWSLWDHSAPIQLDPTAKCNWTEFKSSMGNVARMCTHNPWEDRLVSKAIHNVGRWMDCDALTREILNTTTTETPVFVDIGSNIGSCTMEVLMSTNAQVIAFEPHPSNQFCLTSTLMELPQEVRQRVTYFPIALGSETQRSTIHAASGNFGNSVVGKEIKDFGSQQFQKAIPIAIERLDDLLETSSTSRINLMKLDAQGLECQIMDGMPQVLKGVDKIHTELAGKWLRGQGCSPNGFLGQLRSAQFDVYLNGRHNTKTLLTPNQNAPGGIQTLLALKQQLQSQPELEKGTSI